MQLVSLRHLRLHEATSFAVFPESVQDNLNDLRKVAEEQRPYRVTIVGWVVDRTADTASWREASSSFQHYESIMEKASVVATHFSDRPFGGIAMGQGVRSFRPPPHTVGVILVWAMGSEQYASQESLDEVPDAVPKRAEKSDIIETTPMEILPQRTRASRLMETTSATASSVTSRCMGSTMLL